MVYRVLPATLLVAALCALAACADSATSPKKDCTIVVGSWNCTPD